MPDLPENPQPAAPQGSTRYYSQEDLDAERERVRKEERDKLYPQISRNDDRSKAMDAELKELQAYRKKQEKEAADRDAVVAKARKDAEDAELSAKDLIAKRDAAYEARLDQIQAENARQLAIMAQEVKFNQLQAYIQRRIIEEQDTIAPELQDLIDGDSPEAVEASIERMKTKTEQIVANLRGAQTRQRAAMPGVAPSAGTNGVGPLDTPGDRQISAEDISQMGMGQFAELRKTLGMGGSNNQGLFRQ